MADAWIWHLPRDHFRGAERSNIEISELRFDTDGATADPRSFQILRDSYPPGPNTIAGSVGEGR